MSVRPVFVESGRVDVPHEDPADRFFAATAAVSGVTLISADRHLLWDLPTAVFLGE